MIPATYRFFAVFLVGAMLIGLSFYFFSINSRDADTTAKDDAPKQYTLQTYSDTRLQFQYPSTMAVNARVSPVDNRVFLIDVQNVGQSIDAPIPLRIQIIPRQTKVACDAIGGQAGDTLPVGLTKVQPCLIPKMFQEQGLGMRMEIPRDEFTALLLSDRYDLDKEEVNAMIATIEWK